MASTLPNLQTPAPKSGFLGQSNRLHKPVMRFPRQSQAFFNRVSAKFDLSEILGGRGLCNGEKGIEQELKRNIEQTLPSESDSNAEETGEAVVAAAATVESIPEDGFEKEMMGLTGGFPGGEKGLEIFLERNPPPPKKSTEASKAVAMVPSSKPNPPALPLLMPGMIAIVKNENSPYYMYCGIVQRITDGKAGVLFEGGNWDRLITFRLEELERREKGPPMKNPRSAILETMIEKES